MGLKNKKNAKKVQEKNPKKKVKWKKIMLIILILGIFVIAIKSAISIHNWQEIALEMVRKPPIQSA